MKIIPT